MERSTFIVDRRDLRRLMEYGRPQVGVLFAELRSAYYLGPPPVDHEGRPLHRICSVWSHHVGARRVFLL